MKRRVERHDSHNLVGRGQRLCLAPVDLPDDCEAAVRVEMTGGIQHHSGVSTLRGELETTGGSVVECVGTILLSGVEEM